MKVTQVLLVAALLANAVSPVPEAAAAAAAGFVHEVLPAALYQYFFRDVLSIVTCHIDAAPTPALLM